MKKVKVFMELYADLTDAEYARCEKYSQESGMSYADSLKKKISQEDLFRESDAFEITVEVEDIENQSTEKQSPIGD